MSFFDEESLLTEYAQWVAERQVAGYELNPAAFLIDRAKQHALKRVVDATDYINGLPDDWQSQKADYLIDVIKDITYILEDNNG